MTLPGSGKRVAPERRGDGSPDSRPGDSSSPPHIVRATRTQYECAPASDSSELKTTQPTENELVSLPWMSRTTIRLADVVAFARERRETYFARLQSSSFLSFVEMAQVLLTYAQAPKSAQHIKSSSSCSVIFLIGEHGAGKTTLAKAAKEFVFRYLPRVDARRRGAEGRHTDADDLYPEPWDICPSFIQVQSATATRKDLYHDVNNGFASTGPVVQKHMKSPSAAVGFAGPEALVLVDDAHDPWPWIFGANHAVITGLSDGRRSIIPTSSTASDANQVPDGTPFSQKSSFPEPTPDIPSQRCRVSATKAKPCAEPGTRSIAANCITFDLDGPSGGFRLSQTATPPAKRCQESGDNQGPIEIQRKPKSSRHAESLCEQPLKTASSMLLCLGNAPVPKKGDSAHEIKAGFVDAYRKNLLHMARFKVQTDSSSVSADDSQWASGALSFWKAAAEIMVRRLRPMLVKSAPVDRPTLALYTAICRLSAPEVARLMEMSSIPPVSNTQAEERMKDPLRCGLPPAELQDLFSAGLDALGDCRGFSQASFANSFDAWVTLLGQAIEKRKATQTGTVTEDILQRIRPAHVLWLPTPSSSSNALRDELAAFVDKACLSGDISLNVLEGLECDGVGQHPYPFASLLSPYNVGALVRGNSGEILFSGNGEDTFVWSWATKRKRVSHLRSLLQVVRNEEDVRDCRVDTFMDHLLVTSLPTQSSVQNAAAWIIASRFITSYTDGTILSERGVVGRNGGLVSDTERLACILMHLRAVCSHDTNQESPGFASQLWEEAVALAEQLQHSEGFRTHLNYAFNMFNGLVCAAARSFVSIALDHVHLGQHSAQLAQVVPDDIGRVVADILTTRRDVGARNLHGAASSGIPIDPALALNALSSAKGQGSVRELRHTMRAAAKIYASSLYAERVAAGVEWIGYAIAGSLFRIAFTSPQGESSVSATALHGCREFVAYSDGLPRRGVILSSLLHALSTSSISFVRQCASARQVFAIVSQTAETCDLVTALSNAGVHYSITDMAIGPGDAGPSTPSLSQELPPIGTQPRDETGSPANRVSVSPVINERMTRLSKIHCHSIWALLRAGNIRGAGRGGGSGQDKIGGDFEGSRSSSSSNRDDSSSSSDKSGSGDGRPETEGACFSILVCTASSKLTQVGSGSGSNATFLCGVCLRSRTQVALAAWLSSTKRWKQEVEGLASSPAVRHKVADALHRMKDRCGSTYVGRVKQRRDIQQYFNNYPQAPKSTVPARALVVYDIADQRCRVDMARDRLVNLGSLDSSLELVVPRANEVVADFLRPAYGDTKKNISLRHEAEGLAETYLESLLSADAPLSREDNANLHDMLFGLCIRKVVDRRAITFLNTIYRLSPVLEGMRGRGHAATNLLACAAVPDYEDGHGMGGEAFCAASGKECGMEPAPKGAVGGSSRTYSGGSFLQVKDDGVGVRGRAVPGGSDRLVCSLGGRGHQLKDDGREERGRAVPGGSDRFVRGFGGRGHQRADEKEEERGRAVPGGSDRFVSGFGGRGRQLKDDGREERGRAVPGGSDRFVSSFGGRGHQRADETEEERGRAVPGVADRNVREQRLDGDYRADVGEEVENMKDVEGVENMDDVEGVENMEDVEDLEDVEGAEDVEDVEDVKDVADGEDEPADEMGGDTSEVQMGSTQPDATPMPRQDSGPTSNLRDLAELCRLDPELRRKMEAVLKQHGATPSGLAASPRRPCLSEAESPAKRRKSGENSNARDRQEEDS
jgi:hypothetical protein